MRNKLSYLSDFDYILLIETLIIANVLTKQIHCFPDLINLHRFINAKFQMITMTQQMFDMSKLMYR